MLVPDRATRAKAAIALIAGLVLIARGLGGHGLIILGPGAVVVLGAILSLYGTTTALGTFWVQRGLTISPEEWARWGPLLIPHQDALLEAIVAGKTPRELADQLCNDEGIPKELVLRFIIHIGKGDPMPLAKAQETDIDCR